MVEEITSVFQVGNKFFETKDEAEEASKEALYDYLSENCIDFNYADFLESINYQKKDIIGKF